MHPTFVFCFVSVFLRQKKKDVLQAVSPGCYHILYIFTQNNINELTTNKSYLYFLTLYRF